MSVQTFKAQAMLVSVAFGGGVIIATDSDVIKHEVRNASQMLEDHFRDYPKATGLHVWEGDITVNTGGYVGSEPVDGDIEWNGQFRVATLADIFRFDVLTVENPKAPDAVPTAEVPLLHLKCYHLCVHNQGVSPFDAVKNHSGHYSFELVDPEEGAMAALQAWANDETADGGRTLRHLVIQDRFGERHFIAQRRGQISLYTKEKISFDAYTDFAGVLPNPGVAEMSAEFEGSAA